MGIIPKPETTGKSMAQQHAKKEADINTIMEKYRNTGILGDPLRSKKMIFGDFTALDFQMMQNAIIDVQENFDSLPSRIRKRFGNSPYQLVRWVNDPANRAEAVKLGMLPETEEEREARLKKAASVKVPPPPEKEPEAPKPDDEAQPRKSRKDGD